MKTLHLVAILWLFILHPSSLILQAAEPPPNIVVVLFDDLGFSDLGCYGGEMPTPHIDKLAAGGLRFTEMTNSARCCPSRRTAKSARDAERPSHLWVSKGKARRVRRA